MLNSSFTQNFVHFLQHLPFFEAHSNVRAVGIVPFRMFQFKAKTRVVDALIIHIVRAQNTHNSHHAILVELPEFARLLTRHEHSDKLLCQKQLFPHIINRRLPFACSEPFYLTYIRAYIIYNLCARHFFPFCVHIQSSFFCSQHQRIHVLRQILRANFL